MLIWQLALITFSDFSGMEPNRDYCNVFVYFFKAVKEHTCNNYGRQAKRLHLILFIYVKIWYWGAERGAEAIGVLICIMTSVLFRFEEGSILKRVKVGFCTSWS